MNEVDVCHDGRRQRLRRVEASMPTDRRRGLASFLVNAHPLLSLFRSAEKAFPFTNINVEIATWGFVLRGKAYDQTCVKREADAGRHADY